MPFSQPIRFPEWASGGSAQVVEPSGAKKALGWVPDERPPAEFFNDWKKLVYEWIQYLDQEVNATTALFAAIVGSTPECTHATLEDVMADGTIANGSSILVVSNRTVASTITISKSRLKIIFQGNVEYTEGGAATGFNVTAEGVKFEGGRFLGWTTGGDKVFLLAGTADYCVFRDCRFAVGTATEIDETAVNAGKNPRIETFTEV